MFSNENETGNETGDEIQCSRSKESNAEIQGLRLNESNGELNVQYENKKAIEEMMDCPECSFIIKMEALEDNFYCCPKCGHHFKINSRKRINGIFDKNSFSELYGELRSRDFMEFPGYREKLTKVYGKNNESEAVICGTAKLCGIDCAVFVMESEFMMGSMGTVVGEKIARIFGYASDNCLPVIGFTVSGGARMQEGILSLMQMAKTCGEIKRFSDKGLLYIVVLTDPTTGGVTASFGMAGDIILAEPGATIGFAGARVVEQITRKKLPDGFQKSEFMLKHGFIDRIVPRCEQRKLIGKILDFHSFNSNNG